VANIKQQKKRIGIAERQRLENLRYRSAIKTYFRRLQTAVDGGDAELVTAEHVQLVKLIDRAAARRSLHPNTAARKKSRAAGIVARGPQEQKTRRRAAAKKA
jgi:small subunit ribosomal protein S20